MIPSFFNQPSNVVAMSDQVPPTNYPLQAKVFPIPRGLGFGDEGLIYPKNRLSRDDLSRIWGSIPSGTGLVALIVVALIVVWLLGLRVK